MYYYTYEIYIDDADSSLDGCYYYGKHETSDLEDNYFGSGKLIQRYIKKYGTSKLRKTILEFFDSRDELNKAEQKLVEEKFKTLGPQCINLQEGGTGGRWVEYCTDEEYAWRCNQIRKGMAKVLPEFRAMNAHRAANAKKCASSEQRERWSRSQENRHANMSTEEKRELYSKVSESLRKYYSQNRPTEEKNRQNSETNKIVAKQWRKQFQDIFNATPESFRRKGKMGDALALFHKFQQSNSVDNDLLSKFFKDVEAAEYIPLNYKDPDARGEKLRKYQQQKRMRNAKFIYYIDNKEFYGVNPLIKYIRSTYSFTISREGVESIIERRHRSSVLYPTLVGRISKKENLNEQ